MMVGHLSLLRETVIAFAFTAYQPFLDVPVQGSSGVHGPLCWKRESKHYWEPIGPCSMT